MPFLGPLQSRIKSDPTPATFWRRALLAGRHQAHGRAKANGRPACFKTSISICRTLLTTRFGWQPEAKARHCWPSRTLTSPCTAGLAGYKHEAPLEARRVEQDLTS
jgi:hypothetical protein